MSLLFPTERHWPDCSAHVSPSALRACASCCRLYPPSRCGCCCAAAAGVAAAGRWGARTLDKAGMASEQVIPVCVLPRLSATARSVADRARFCALCSWDHGGQGVYVSACAYCCVFSWLHALLFLASRLLSGVKKRLFSRVCSQNMHRRKKYVPPPVVCVSPVTTRPFVMVDCNVVRSSQSISLSLMIPSAQRLLHGKGNERSPLQTVFRKSHAHIKMYPATPTLVDAAETSNRSENLGAIVALPLPV